jgi:glycosyltransferase involved in cell wall biosynthesis
MRIRAALREWLRRPLYATTYFAIWIYVRLYLRSHPIPVTPLWRMAESTKNSRQTIIFSSYDDLNNPHYAGGGAIAVHQVAKRLAHESDITVLTGRYRGAEDITRDNVHYRRIGTSRFGPKIGQLIFTSLLPWYVMRLQFDVWVESFTPPFSTACLQLFTRKPVIGLVHMLAGKDMFRKYYLPFFLIERIGLKTYRRFIVLTEVVAKIVRRSNPKASIDVINNGVDFPINQKVVLKKEYISYIGRIEVNQKGLDLLLKAYALVADRLPCKLAIAGTGAKEELAKLQTLIDDLAIGNRVKLFGRVSGTEKSDFFSQSAFVVIPSRHETFSLVALETLSYGLPVLAFDIDGLKWLPDYCCLKTPPFNYETLGNNMLALALQPELHTQLALQGRAYINNFGWDNISLKYRESISAACHPI